jgi:hypothetical protein
LNAYRRSNLEDETIKEGAARFADPNWWGWISGTERPA